MKNPGTTGDHVGDWINSVGLSAPAYYTGIVVLSSAARSRMSFALYSRIRAKPYRKQMAEVGIVQAGFLEQEMSLFGHSLPFEVR